MPLCHVCRSGAAHARDPSKFMAPGETCDRCDRTMPPYPEGRSPETTTDGHLVAERSRYWSRILLAGTIALVLLVTIALTLRRWFA